MDFLGNSKKVDLEIRKSLFCIVWNDLNNWVKNWRDFWEFSHECWNIPWDFSIKIQNPIFNWISAKEIVTRKFLNQKEKSMTQVCGVKLLKILKFKLNEKVGRTKKLLQLFKLSLKNWILQKSQFLRNRN